MLVFCSVILAENVILVGICLSNVLAARGGATVLKVGGTNSASEASRKIFFDPPRFLASGGRDKILLR